MDRKATSEIMCMRCLKIQPVGPVCSTPSCGGFSMANYYCNICRFFDDERTVYHCPFCNLCRVGKGLGIDFFHCMKCNCCLAMKLVDHKCREKGLETNCPICCDFLLPRVQVSELSLVAISCIQVAFRHTLAAITPAQFVANRWEICRFTLACLMLCWLLKSFQKNTGTVVRIYYAMTVTRRERHPSTGFITNVTFVGPTIQGLLSLTQRIQLAQLRTRNINLYILPCFCGL
ncbi:hypothetical protein K2173_001842 [Erythroxylum novogranatense]|uniref:CTCHY-type domain-containing protein n=1 Tax=Erythroxylum novogranatense TaxID=1862640 RepID=A0AAV8TQK1_9ROSI|nr:hypothetical protein K2173_001842 [Erythroxylum novogranatense]